MYKVTSGELIEGIKLIDKAEKALNTLEKLTNNKIIYPELRIELQKYSSDIKTRYLIEEMDEWKK